ncbi:MAG: hypothetical protein ABIH28_00205 [archaeon]
MNIIQKLNETGLARKINSCDFGLVLEAISESTYQEITNKKIPLSQRRISALLSPISYPIQILAGYIFLKSMKSTRD